MSRIPVGKTISDAYGYAFGQFPANLGITWLPMALLLAAMAFILPLYFQATTHIFDGLNALQPGVPPDMSGVTQVYRYGVLLLLLEVALLTQIMLGMTRRALGLQQGPVFVFFSVGKPYWLLLGAYLVMVVLYYAAAVVVGIAAAIVAGVVALVVGISMSGASAVGLSVAAVLGVFLLVVACIMALIYVMSRLTFLLTPAIVVENRFALMRSWELTKGNFWRIFVIGLAVFGPIVILALIVDGFLFAQIGPPMLQTLRGVPGNDPQAMMRAMSAITVTMMNMMRQYWYAYAVVSLVVSAVTYGLMAGAAASAYRSQTEGTGSPAAFS